MIETKDPDFRLLRDELFGPVVTAYVYPEGEYSETLDLVDRTAPYGLTGAVFARDRSAIELAGEKLQYAAGNFYVNDKPTGAVVGQQPFGGARASGTNDKAGSMWNLIRWVSPRTIKETFVPPTDYRYPFLDVRVKAYAVLTAALTRSHRALTDGAYGGGHALPRDSSRMADDPRPGHPGQGLLAPLRDRERPGGRPRLTALRGGHDDGMASRRRAPGRSSRTWSRSSPSRAPAAARWRRRGT